MLIIDRDSGTFLFSRPRPAQVDEESGQVIDEKPPGTLLTQLWAPIDFMTAPFERGTSPTEEWSKVVVMAWVIDDAGDERDFNLAADGYSQITAISREIFGEDFSEFSFVAVASGLSMAEEFPETTPEVIRDAVEARQKMRLEAVQSVVDVLNQSTGQNVWLRLYGGDAIAGKLTGFTKQGTCVVLEKPRRLRGAAESTKNIPISKIAAARAVKGRGKIRNFDGYLFPGYVEQTEPPACDSPQLWKAVCPSCHEVVTPPWVSGSCWSCRAGEIRDQYWQLSDERLERILDARAEWQELNVVVEQAAGGRWKTAFRTADGDAVEIGFGPTVMSVEDADKRTALIELLDLAKFAGFYLNPPEDPAALGPRWQARPTLDMAADPEP